MRLIDADAFKEYVCNAYEQVKHMYPDGGEWARQITEDFCKDIDEQPTIDISNNSNTLGALDCVSRQEVIAEFNCCELTPDGGIDANYAIDFLKQLPSIQPETNCSEIPNSSDLISRQAAIDVLNRGLSKIPYVNNTDTEMIRRDERIGCIQEIRELPSAQPEIIRCKDCRYSIDEYGDGECYCKRPSRELVWIGKRWDFFWCGGKVKDGGGA